MRKLVHKEGKPIISIVSILLVVLNILILTLTHNAYLQVVFLFLSAIFLLFILRFFRIPNRSNCYEKDVVFSPADGKVVVVEKTFEKEYLKTECIQISVFMSVWNIHINWFPVKGKVTYLKYHKGKYLVARHPKSSELNERNTIVIKTNTNIEVLFRQIAGFVARRIVSYAELNGEVSTEQETGFIKFGSRLDVFLPTNTSILVKPGDTVRGSITKLALLKKP